MNQSMQKNRPLRALVISPSRRLASYQIGIAQPFGELERRGVAAHTVMEEQEASGRDIEAADVVVFLRNTTRQAYTHLQYAASVGTPTVYSIDDHFLHLPERGFGLAMKEPDKRDTFIGFMRNADVVRVGSPYFARHIRETYNEHVACIEASVDFGWLAQAGAKTRNAGQVVIGYEGSYKEDDFAVVVPALLRLLRQYGKRIRLEFHGYAPERLIGRPGVVYFAKGCDYRSFLHRLAQRSWDVGIAPLNDNLYNRCKSNNKFREYAACGVAGVYSKLSPYIDCVVDGETGLLAEGTADAWYARIAGLIEDAALRKRIRRQARSYVRERYTISRCADEWLGLLSTVGAGGAIGASGAVSVSSEVGVSREVGVSGAVGVSREVDASGAVGVVGTDDTVVASDAVIASDTVGTVGADRSRSGEGEETHEAGFGLRDE